MRINTITAMVSIRVVGVAMALNAAMSNRGLSTSEPTVQPGGKLQIITETNHATISQKRHMDASIAQIVPIRHST